MVRVSAVEAPMTKHRIFSISVASVYPHYIAKAEKKGRMKAEVDEIIRWLTGYSQKARGITFIEPCFPNKIFDGRRQRWT